MELRHLRYFVAVAEELSFSRAANRLHIAQPPLSQQIRDLEGEIGLQLFDRSRRSIILTVAGKDFLNNARQVLSSVAKLERETQLRASGSMGRIAIAVNTTIITPHFFASILRAFQRKNPGIKFSLVDLISVRQLEALLAGEIDVGLLRAPMIPDLIETHPIKRESMRIAVPLNHKLAKLKHVEWRDLAHEQLILIQPEMVRNFYEEFYMKCRAAGFEPRVQQYVPSLSTQLWLISAGLGGIAPMPLSPEIEKHSGVVFVALPPDAPVYETAMAWRRDDKSPALRRFIEFVKQGDKQV